jgi:hypothetical protein
MSDRWNIVFMQGAAFKQSITVAGVDDIADAVEWTLRFAMPNEAPFLIATTTNGMIVPTATANTKIFSVPASVTELFAAGNGRFDFEIEFPSNDIRRYVAASSCSIIPQIGGI